ncbi:hypothetical protein [Amycolatopsis speibonae]|uniref:Uncharacterized protein n=1 Tax=Amycolatopsis speibonae TaxID=1450224 RepID=A0ABV7NWX5_9PSEU
MADLQRRYVSLHLKLDEGGIDIQSAMRLSRQYDDTARRLRNRSSSGAEALTAYGLL